MQARFVTIRTKKLIGKKLQMSVIHDRTPELWQSFMPRRKEVTNLENNFLYSVQIFESDQYFDKFSPEIEFEKWAAVEVAEFTNIPEDMEKLEIPEGLYVVFNYKGSANAALPFFQYIFQTWIPESEYLVDNRPHFALMGERYRGNNPDSEEEIWVPVKKKLSNIE